jgi:hypothetical protein
VDVFVNGNLVVPSLDVAKRIGGSYGYFTYSVTGPLPGGVNTFELRASVGKILVGRRAGCCGYNCSGGFTHQRSCC